MSTELQIKLAHIGMEPAIIRKHEKRIKRRIARLKAKGANDLTADYRKLHNLQSHRRWEVRNAARATHLALGYLKGVSYKAMEQKTCERKRDLYIVPDVVRMIRKYGVEPGFDREKLQEWFDA